MAETLQRALAIVQALPASTPCMACDHLDQPTGRCHVWQSVVPPEHRAAGCPKFEDTIPF
jgi:hypothetical protein